MSPDRAAVPPSPPDSPLPVHVRTIRMEAVECGPGELAVTGTLLDERPRQDSDFLGEREPRVIHDMRVTLRVRHPDLVITAAEGDMAARPYTLCTDALAPLARLVGLSVRRGFTRSVNERLGRAAGCAHLTALVQAMAPVVRQAAGAAFDHPSAQSTDESARWFVDTCQAWRRDGPLHRMLERGDHVGIRALSAYEPLPPAG